MSQLIEKENRYFKKCSVVMLPDTNEINYSRVCFREETNEFRFDAGIGVHNLIKIGFKPQHLYITSSDKVEEDDWCIDKRNGFPKVTNKTGNFVSSKKVIATTDRSIEESKTLKNIIQKATEIASKDVIKPKVVRGGKIYKKSLKSIPIDFIKAYCDKGGIDKVLVEYERYRICKEDSTRIICAQFKPCDCDYLYKIKTDSHNTITIKPVEEKMYSGKEVEKLCRNAMFTGELLGRNPLKPTSLGKGFDEISNNWIKENL